MHVFLLQVVVAALYCSLRSHALPDLITVGGIFDPYDQRQLLAFQYAVERINADPKILSRSKLQSVIENLPADDSFHASKKVCDILRNGVAAIFGPQSENTANHVQSICDALEVPHIETRWDFKLRRDEYSLNLYPHPSSISRAYYDVIKRLDWKNFVVLYDSSEGLIRLQTLLKAKEFTVTVRQLNDGDDWRPLLKEIKKSQETKLVIDVKQEKIFNVMKQASQIGLMSEYHSYFITSLDLHLVDMEDFQKRGTNITALRLVDPKKPEAMKFVDEWKYGEQRYRKTIDEKVARLTTESALMYDAVFVFARALDDLDRSKNVDISPLYCEGDKKWSHGSSLISYMKWFSSRRTDTEQDSVEPYPPMMHGMSGGLQYGMSMNGRPGMSMRPDMRAGMSGMGNINRMGGIMGTGGSIHLNISRSYDQVYGMTGLIKFDNRGFRTDFELDILELDMAVGLLKVGVWSKKGGANYTRNTETVLQGVPRTLHNRTLIVTTAPTAPYTMLKEKSKHLKGNDKFEGFCVDLIHEISLVLHFNYSIELVADGSYGNKDKDTGQWNGMVRDLLDHKADLGIVDFTITYEREEAVDFSMPFMNLGISIIYKKPVKKAPSLFSFMSPFSLDVWIYMATAYLGVSVLLFMLARMCPKEWDSPYPCIEEPDQLENCFTLKNALWFNIATFLCQGADIAPRAVSTRIVAGIWWFFTLIMISSYTANLAAFLTVEGMESTIKGAEDLAKQTKIKYGSKHGGSTYGFFKESKIPTYARMWNAMDTARPTVFTESSNEGVDRVLKGDGMYAFMMESSSIDYVVERQCDLMQVGGLLDSKSYGIALPPGSPYTNAISSAILFLKENGVLHKLKTKWWKRRKGGGRCTSETKEEPSGAAELGLDNVGGVFVVMAGGLALACITACCEFTWKARKLATEEGDTFRAELWKEIKFILNCSENVKPVRKKHSPHDTESSNYSASTYGYSNNQN